MAENRPPSNTNNGPTVAEVDAVVECELRRDAFRPASDLIEKHFCSNPKVSKAAQRIFDTLVEKKIWNAHHNKGRGKWKGLPANPSSKMKLYHLLSGILNSITELCDPKDRTFDIVWHDEHATNRDAKFMADARPDIAAVIQGGRAWWGALHTLIQVKKKADTVPAAFGLLRFAYQTLREQFDRRFMYGMVFLMYNLTIWHVDRSGALASEVFNIHEEPLKFIKVILSFVMLKPEELGWDPTMKMYVEDIEDGKTTRRYGLPSYTIKEHDESSARNAFERMWIVSVPKHGAQHDESSYGDADAPPLPLPEEEEFVVFNAVCLPAVEILEGRSTRIWKAWKMEEMDLPVKQRHVYIIKDCWRDERQGHEGAFYVQAGVCPGVALHHSHGDVRIGGRGNIDCTLKLVRKKIKAQGRPLDLQTDQRYETPWSQDHFAILTGWEYRNCVPRNRIHMRLVMASHGYSLTKFSTLQELLGALHDAMQGHKYLYENGVLHRDISLGNILITGLPAPNRGVLIDLDNAINWKDPNTRVDDERRGTLAFMSCEIISNREFIPGTPEPGPAYLEGYMPYNMYWDASDKFGPVGLEGVTHDAVHDLESFFWVLCWLCVSREGPGRARHFNTDGLGKEEAAKAIRIYNTIASTFEHNSMNVVADRKRSILGDVGSLTRTILNSFSPYFKPLESLIRWIHGDLHRAYRDRNFEGLHEKFLEYLSAAEQSSIVQGWEATESVYQEMSEAVLKLRGQAETVWDSAKLERTQAASAPSKMASSGHAQNRDKRRRADELEDIAAQAEGEPSSALSEERNTRSAARKRRRMASSSRGQQEAVSHTRSKNSRGGRMGRG